MTRSRIGCWAPVICVCLMLLFLAAPVTARAETIDDAGVWLALFARGNLSDELLAGRTRWWFDGHARFFDDLEGFGQSIVRPGVGYALSDTTTIWAGYGWIRTSATPIIEFDENRVWQQVTWSDEFFAARFGSRSRLEQRFVETGSDTGWRFRQLASWRRDLPRVTPRLSAVAWNEVFLNFNSTDWGADGGFDQNRAFFGLGWKLDAGCHNLRVETGYLNQHIDLFGRLDITNHLLSVNLYRSP